MKGEIAVRYTIRHFDLPLLTFEANMDSADTDLHIITVSYTHLTLPTIA